MASNFDIFSLVRPEHETSIRKNNAKYQKTKAMLSRELEL